MPVQIGKAGTGAREIARKRAVRIYGCLFGFLTGGSLFLLVGNKLLHFNLWILNLIGWLGIGFGIGLIVVIYKVVLDPKEDIDRTIDRAMRGAKAEEEVSDILEELPKGYAVFNDFPCPMGNIDHIIIGPTGIFVVETKSHSGEITLSPDKKLLRNSKPLEKDFLKQVLEQCFWLKKKLIGPNEKAPFITPIVVFTRAFVKVYQPVKGVRIVNKKWLVKDIVENNGKIRKDELNRIFYELLRLKDRASTIRE
ncbi:MAG: NERD domain-containing protein [Thermosipho sp. (in: Bacteria)]|nr:NERD domain-containing protein [Thermosipho sp. (in: thermotogales)]